MGRGRPGEITKERTGKRENAAQICEGGATVLLRARRKTGVRMSYGSTDENKETQNGAPEKTGGRGGGEIPKKGNLENRPLGWRQGRGFWLGYKTPQDPSNITQGGNGRKEEKGRGKWKEREGGKLIV